MAYGSLVGTKENQEKHANGWGRSIQNSFNRAVHHPGSLWITDFLACWAYIFRQRWRGFDNFTTTKIQHPFVPGVGYTSNQEIIKESYCLYSSISFSGDIVILFFHSPKSFYFPPSSVLTLIVVSAWLTVSLSDSHPYHPSSSVSNVLDLLYTKESNTNRDSCKRK